VSLCGLLRNNGFSADLDPGTKGFKAQFKKADREGAALALVIGGDELAAGTYTMKDLKSGEQESIRADSVLDFLKKKLTRT
jgi:histidyl-tRNA synthetase